MYPEFSEHGAYLVARFSGEIDHHSAGEIKDAVDKYYSQSGRRHIIMDFGDVTFMDSSGIGMIIGRYKKAGINGGKVYAVGLSPVVGRIFDISGLRKIISCHDSVNDVLKGVGHHV